MKITEEEIKAVRMFALTTVSLPGWNLGRLNDAREIEAYLTGADLARAEQAQPQFPGEDLPDMGDPDNFTMTSAPQATGEVVSFTTGQPMAETVSPAEPAPEPAQRKARGRPKGKAAKKTRAKRETAFEPIDDSIPHMEPAAASEPAAAPQEIAQEQASLAA